MLIREIMHKNPITISPETPLCEAYKIMQEKNIRHLPVIENEKLIGIVTDRDLRLATSKLAEKPFNPKDCVKEIMSSPVQTTAPSDPIEIATKIMRELKISSLPVLENQKLVGIVTGADLLDAMLKLTGVHRPSGRLDVELSNRSGELARLTNIIAKHKINIHSILTYPEQDNKIRVVLRINTMEIKILAEEICSSDFVVIWPPHISCAK
jgi:acetoin utilization protein AcuB